MDPASEKRHADAIRPCGIAGRLGYRVICPDGGCALLRALGEERPIDPDETCPVEGLCPDDNELVLRTLDELRREMERRSAKLRALRAERERARRHAETLRRWG